MDTETKKRVGVLKQKNKLFHWGFTWLKDVIFSVQHLTVSFKTTTL